MTIVGYWQQAKKRSDEDSAKTCRYQSFLNQK